MVCMLKKHTKNQCLLIKIFVNLFYFVYAWSSFLHGFSLVVASGGTLQLQCTGFALQWLLLLWSTDSRVLRLQQLQCMGSVVMIPMLQSMGSIVVVHGFSCSMACGIFSDQGQYLCLLHWQADSPLLTPRGTFFSFSKLF